MKVVDASASNSPEITPEAERSPERKLRRPYQPPAIESSDALAPITLGTRPAMVPPRGC